MYVKIAINGREAVQTQIQNKLSAFAAKVGNAVQGTGIECEAGAKILCPVDTGRLRASIQYVKITALSCRVGTNVKYAKFVELGTHRMAPRPYLFPAYLEAKKNLMKEIKALAA